MSKFNIANYLLHSFSILGDGSINEEKISRTVDVLVQAWDNDRYLSFCPRSLKANGRNKDSIL